MTFIGGLDWSGDSGIGAASLEHDRYLVVCSVHTDVDQHLEVHDTLNGVRHRLRIPENHTFKFVRSMPMTRQMLFSAVENLEITVVATVFDKTKWPRDSGAGQVALVSALCSHCLHLPRELVERQLLLIDAGKGERSLIRRITLDLRRECRLMEASSFKKIAARPDTRTDAGLVQLADLYAGSIRKDFMSGTVGQRYPHAHIIVM